MPEFTPFTGLRPQPSVTGPLDGVVCPPYDVITESQRTELMARSPYNVVRVELPNGDYSGAAQLLDRWERDGAFVRDRVPAFYGYRMTYEAPDGVRRQTLGVMGALTLEPPGRGILPHEQTTPKAKSDRLELLRSTRTNTSPIWCLCAQKGLNAAIGAGTPAGTLAVATDDDATRHEIWPLVDPGVVEAIGEVVGAAPLLVADGHHRYETALSYQDDTKGPGSQAPKGASALLALVAELSEDHLAVMAIHRAVSGLPPGFELADALSGQFTLVPTSATGGSLLQQMVTEGGLGLVTRRGTWLARPRPGSPADGYDLDSSRVDAVLATLPTHQVAYEHDIVEAMRSVASGALDAAIFCRPATVNQIARTAAGGVRMPPKTTFFWPKPRTGLVFRRLD